MSAVEIAAIYVQRWQIETFFKKLIITFRLPTFLVTTPTLLKYKYGVLLIALLMLDVMHKDHNSNIHFSILVTLIMFHIMNYVAKTAIIKN